MKSFSNLPVKGRVLRLKFGILRVKVIKKKLFLFSQLEMNFILIKHFVFLTE